MEKGEGRGGVGVLEKIIKLREDRKEKEKRDTTVC